VPVPPPSPFQSVRSHTAEQPPPQLPADKPLARTTLPPPPDQPVSTLIPLPTPDQKAATKPTISPGMSIDQVVALLGPPDKIAIWTPRKFTRTRTKE
jgi:hypothetical protein